MKPKKINPRMFDPCPYLVKYLTDVLKKKTKVLDIFNIEKMFYGNYYRMKS